MALTRGFIRNAATTPLDARLMDAGQIVGNADGSVRPGVLDGDGRVLVTALATMNVAVAAADFVTTKGAADGAVIFTNDGAVNNVAISAAPASNSRIDVIWVRHQDNTTGDAASTPIFGVTAGVASAGPVKPAIPTGALELATLRVWAGTTAANGGTNTLTNTYQMTASRGGIVVVRDSIERNAWTNPQRGQRIFQMSGNRVFAWVVTSGAPGGAWLPDAAAFLATRSSGQVLNPGGWWVVSTAFAAPAVNELGAWVGANGTLQVTHAGLYRVAGLAKLANPSNPMAIQITKNSSAPDVNVIVDGFANSSMSSLNTHGLVLLAAGDVLRLLVYTSGATTVADAQLTAELVSLT